MTPTEKLRFVSLYGHISKVDNLWQWSAAPDRECVIRTMRSPSRWDLIEFIYDQIKDSKGVNKIPVK